MVPISRILKKSNWRDLQDGNTFTGKMPFWVLIIQCNFANLSDTLQVTTEKSKSNLFSAFKRATILLKSN